MRGVCALKEDQKDRRACFVWRSEGYAPAALFFGNYFLYLVTIALVLLLLSLVSVGISRALGILKDVMGGQDYYMQEGILLDN